MTQVLHPLATAPRTVLKNPSADGLLVGLAALHGAVLLLWPNLLTVGLGLWWNANTVSHYFVHRPFFRVGAVNAAFSMLLSVLLGLPQSIWRDRHLAHHAGVEPRIRRTPLLAAEIGVVAGLWTTLCWFSPSFFLFAYLPGIGLGLSLCAIHGHFEHAGGADTTSHYGRLYNFVFLHDGYHVEHHAHPACDWRTLPRHRVAPPATGSRWPAVLRFCEHPLETLERLVLPRPWLQRFVLDQHRSAWRELLPHLGPVSRVGIIGGGLFPRTALLLRDLLPETELTLIDADATHLEIARQRLAGAPSNTRIEFEAAWFDRQRHTDFDLLVFPLDYRGDDAALLQENLPAPAVVFHAWIWQTHGRSAVVSPWLLKRMNLVKRGGSR